jgi:hypothetical protein
MVHKALNLIQRKYMRLPASRSSILLGFADASDASDDLSFVRVLSRIGQRSGNPLSPTAAQGLPQGMYAGRADATLGERGYPTESCGWCML